MKRKIAFIGLILGLVGVAGLSWWLGLGDLAALWHRGGWALGLVVLFIIPDYGFSSLAWRGLFRVPRALSFWAYVRANWAGSAVNTLLPVATIGGEVVKARVIILAGAKSGDATAATFADKTAQAVSILLWALIGLALLAWRLPERPEVALFGLVGALILALGITGFILVQKGAVSWFAFRREGLGKAASEDLAFIYRHPWPLVWASLIRLLDRMVLAGEIMLAAYLFGQPLLLVDAILLKSLSMALRAAAFVVPGGWGVQEGGYIAIGALLGLPPDLMLALSLASRLREVLPALPGLYFWQKSELQKIRG